MTSPAGPSTSAGTSGTRIPGRPPRETSTARRSEARFRTGSRGAGSEVWAAARSTGRATRSGSTPATSGCAPCTESRTTGRSPTRISRATTVPPSGCSASPAPTTSIWRRLAALRSPCPRSPSAIPTACSPRRARRWASASITCPRPGTRWPTAAATACRACSTCAVCPTGAKASIDLTSIPQAEATGNAQIIPEATVLRLETDRSGQASAAVYAGRDKLPRRLTARVFVVAAGAVETARLLLLSASRDFPGGLANRSGLVGKLFMSHPSMDIIGRARENVYPYRIGFSTAMSRQFAIERDRATRGAFFLEFLNSAGPTPERIAAASGLSGQALRQHVHDEFGHWLGIRVYCEQLPTRVNAVSLAPGVKDYFGSPGPHIHCVVGQYERKALDEAKDVATRILTAMGLSRGPGHRRDLCDAHQIGTHRMGTDPRASVVDANLMSHDIPNLYLVGSGCFVTASASPPTLTIVALAIRVAEHLAAKLRPAAARSAAVSISAATGRPAKPRRNSGRPGRLVRAAARPPSPAPRRWPGRAQEPPRRPPDRPHGGPRSPAADKHPRYARPARPHLRAIDERHLRCAAAAGASSSARTAPSSRWAAPSKWR